MTYLLLAIAYWYGYTDGKRIGTLIGIKKGIESLTETMVGR